MPTAREIQKAAEKRRHTTGRSDVYCLETGEKITRFHVDADELVKTGKYVRNDPNLKGKDGKPVPDALSVADIDTFTLQQLKRFCKEQNLSVDFSHLETLDDKREMVKAHLR